MDCCSSGYSEFNKTHHLHHPHFQGATPPVNSPYYPSMYNSPHSMRYPHHLPAMPPSHIQSLHRNEPILANPAYGSNMREQQQNFYDVGGGANNPNIYDRYNHSGYPSQNHTYNGYSNSFNNYGSLRDCYNTSSESSNYYYNQQQQAASVLAQQQRQQQHQQQQSNAYYSAHHSYDSYRNLSSAFPYHSPIQSSHPYNYHQSSNMQREFYPYNSEHFNSSNSNNNTTRYYPTPPPSAPLPSSFTQQPMSRDSYPLQDACLRSATPALPPANYPSKELYYPPAPIPESNRKHNIETSEDNTKNIAEEHSSSIASSNSNYPESPNKNRLPKHEQSSEFVKTPATSPQTEPQTMPNTINCAVDERKTPTTSNEQSEQRQQPTSSPNPIPMPNQSKTPSSPQNQLQEQTMAETTSSSYDNNTDSSNSNQNNSHQQPMTPTTTELSLSATGFPFSSNNNNNNHNNTNNSNNVKESNSSRARKSPRDKDKLLKSISSSRKMFDTQLPNNESYERCGTPFTTMPPYNQNHHMYNNNYPPSSQRFLPNQPTPPPSYWFSQSHSHQSWMMNPYQRNRRASFMDAQMLPSTMNYHRNGMHFEKHKMMQNSGIMESNESPPLKRTKKRAKPELPQKPENKEDAIMKNITPLPGFQQAFGSTEIGKFSEAFFNTPESPNPYYNSIESDVESPQPWEYGDSLEGPHINLQIGAAFQPLYNSSETDFDSPPMSNYFSELACNEY